MRSGDTTGDGDGDTTGDGDGDTTGDGDGDTTGDGDGDTTGDGDGDTTGDPWLLICEAVDVDPPVTAHSRSSTGPQTYTPARYEVMVQARVMRGAQPESITMTQIVKPVGTRRQAL